MAIKHGQTYTPTYRSWEAMKYRCNRESYSLYREYGGRGITYCERWEKFENFFADMGHRPAGKTLDRIDTDGNYEPSNCRWADASTQRRNRRDVVWHEVNGEKMLLEDIAKIIGITSKLLSQWLTRDKLTIAQALERKK